MHATRHAARGLLLLALFALLVGCGAGKPEKFAQRFYQTVAEGKVDRAVDMFSFEGVREAEMTTARGKVTMAVGEMQARITRGGGLDSVEVVSVTENPEGVRVHSRLKLKNGGSLDDYLQLAREGREWKIRLN